MVVVMMVMVVVVMVMVIINTHAEVHKACILNTVTLTASQALMEWSSYAANKTRPTQ